MAVIVRLPPHRDEALEHHQRDLHPIAICDDIPHLWPGIFQLLVGESNLSVRIQRTMSPDFQPLGT